MLSAPIPQSGRSVKDWALPIHRRVESLGRIRGDNKMIFVEYGDNATTIRGKFDWEAKILGCKLIGNKVTVYARTLRIHGLGNFAVAETTVTLGGSPEYVFIQRARSGGSATVGHSTTEPTSGDTIRVPLAKYVKQGSIYVLDTPCLLWDVNLGAPTP